MFSLIAALIAPRRNAFADRGELLLENAAPRQQLGVYWRNGNRPLLTSADRRFWVWLSRCWPRWRTALVMVQPKTVIRWHREAWKRYWTWKSRHRSPGRPRIAPEVRELIIRMARENSLWVPSASAASSLA